MTPSNRMVDNGESNGERIRKNFPTIKKWWGFNMETDSRWGLLISNIVLVIRKGGSQRGNRIKRWDTQKKKRIDKFWNQKASFWKLILDCPNQMNKVVSSRNSKMSVHMKMKIYYNGHILKKYYEGLEIVCNKGVGLMF